MIYLVIFMLLNIVFYFSTCHCCLCRWRMSLCILLCAPFQDVSLGESLGMTKPSQWNDSLLNLNRALSPHSSAYWRGKIKNWAWPCESCKLSAVRRVASPRDRAGDPVSCSACTSLPWSRTENAGVYQHWPEAPRQPSEPTCWDVRELEAHGGPSWLITPSWRMWVFCLLSSRPPWSQRVPILDLMG